MEIQNGRPADESGRLPKEIAVYNLLERLDIPFARADHAAAFTMEACESISAALQTPVCKNLFLCNRQKTNFYLLLMPADKPFRTKEITSQLLVDRDLLGEATFGCHPCINTSTIRMQTGDVFDKLTTALHHPYTIVTLKGE